MHVLRLLRHTVLLWEVLRGRLLGRVCRVLVIDTVLTIRGRFWGIETSLNQVLTLCLGDKRLKLRCCEGVDKTSLRDNEEKDLSASEDGQFVGLLHDTSLAFGEGDMSTRLVCDELDLDLSALTTGLVIIIVVVVRGRGTLALDTATFN